MPPLANPTERYWRTDLKRGRGVYALISNDVDKTSEYDPLVGVMETSELAEDVVGVHNALLTLYGRHYYKRVVDLE